jgi:hypothetical protein
MTTVVFSGHMIDAPGREQPRFPQAHAPWVRARLEAAISGVEDAQSEAISGAACGGDLLFCQAWLETDRDLEVFLPREPEAFLDESVRFAGFGWEESFRDVTDHPRTKVVGPRSEMVHAENPHPANNARIIERARRGTPPLVGIFVWDGGGGEGPGGTQHMVSQVEDASGEVIVIEP